MAEALLSGIVALSEDAIVATDSGEKIIMASDSAERMFGYRAGEMTGLDLDALIPVTSSERHREEFRKFLASADTLRPMHGRSPIRGRRKDGTEFPAEGSISKFSAGGTTVCCVRLRDLTSLEAERAHLKESEQTALAAAEEARRRHGDLEDRLTLLVEASRRLLSAHKREEVLNRILDLARRLLKADAYAIWRVNPGVREWRIAASAGIDESYVRQATYPGSKTFDPPGEPLAIPNIENDPRMAGRAAHLVSLGIRSLLAVPLEVAAGPPGAITFYCRSEYSFSQTDRRVATALANLSASAIAASELLDQQTRMRTQAEEAERRAAFLAEATALLGASLDYETTLRSVARLAVPVFADWCAIDIRTEAGSTRRLVIAHSDPERIRHAEEMERRYPPRPGAKAGVPHVLQTGQSELYPDIPGPLLASLAENEEHVALMRGLGLKSGIIVPMKARGRVLGAITFVTADSGRRYGTDDLAIAEHLGCRAALAVDNASLYEAAQRERADAQMALEALQRSNEELQNFAYVASHDLQEPLRVVASFTQLLMKRYKGKLGQEADEFIDFIIEGVQRMHQLIHDLLSYSRAMSTAFTGLNRVDAQAALNTALENLRVSIEESGARVERTPLPTVLAEYIQLVQLFQNLIGNAIKYRSADRPPLICVRAAEREQDWLFSVEDNGIGIETEYRDRIFGIFKRLHGRSTPGTGVGLAICKKVVERYGGRIWVDSTPGEGSTFYFTIPK